MIYAVVLGSCSVYLVVRVWRVVGRSRCHVAFPSTPARVAAAVAWLSVTLAPDLPSTSSR